MNVLLIGSGGREHALALKISESKKLNRLYIAPGNPGTTNLGENILLNISDHDSVIKFCEEHAIELVVIGPEQPLVDGLADNLSEKNIPVFGPKQNAAIIEGDKSFSKELMKKYNIPTASFEIFKSTENNNAINYLRKTTYPTVIKAKGLAAGKGVSICSNFEEAEKAVEDCFVNNVFGDSGDEIVIEEFLTGEEASIFVITDGKEYVLLPASQDHKQIYDGDKGPNTGGMGAYAPAPVITNELLREIEDKIIKQTIYALNEEERTFIGCIYVGLMITKDGPKVIEYNCRFGDPETQAVLPIIDGDFLELLYSSSIGKINKTAISYDQKKTAVCVVTVSEGYPGKYEKGKEIVGLENTNEEGIIVYHAGTKEEHGKIYTNGGRVLGITSVLKEDDIRQCKQIAYNAISKICYSGIFYRKDISDKAIK